MFTIQNVKMMVYDEGLLVSRDSLFPSSLVEVGGDGVPSAAGMIASTGSRSVIEYGRGVGVDAVTEIMTPSGDACGCGDVCGSPTVCFCRV